MMCIYEQPIAGGVLWRLEGRLSYEADALLCRHLARVTDRERQVVMDFAGVSMIDAAGVGALVTVVRACRERRIPLSLVSVPTRVRRLLTMLQLADVLPLAESVEDARAHREPSGDVRPLTLA
jgi:anti-anti-sigma factor